MPLYQSEVTKFIEMCQFAGLKKATATVESFLEKRQLKTIAQQKRYWRKTFENLKLI